MKSCDTGGGPHVPRLRWLWLVFVALFAGCTSIKLVYPRLEWYTQFKLGKYVKLEPAQEALLKQDVDAFWAWHRADELPRYAAEFRALAAVDPETIDVATLTAWGDRMGGYGRAAVERAMPGLCALARTLDDRQVASIGEQMTEDLEKFEDEHLKPDEDERRRNAAKRLAKQVKRWSGSLNDAQEQELDAWRDRHPLLGAETLALRQKWRAAFLAALSMHGDPDQCTALGTLFLDPRALRDDATQARFEASETELRQTLSRIIAASDTRQREHAQRELLKLADDLEALSRRS
ncbi:MAG TPA: DUF6279 family lipoprotein [Nevskiaceae bacterium]|nr:DUF6279 family lipoprotein [Nevskiaceae bacterium]